MGRNSTVDKVKVIELFRKGMTYRAIAKILNSKEDTIRMIIKRNASAILSSKREERKKKNKKEQFDLQHSNLLNVDDFKQLREERYFGLNTNESVGIYGFLLWNRQSYKLSKSGKKFIFDESRGKKTDDVPPSY